MDQRTDELNTREDDEFRVTGHGSVPEANEQQELASREGEIEQTRAHMTETIGAIQERLAPERLSDEAKDAAVEAVDHAVHEVRTTAQELSELARVAALEAIDHAVEEAQAALPVIGEQARSMAQETVSHAIEETKAAVRELGAQASAAARDATIGKVERMANSTGQTTKSFSSKVLSTMKQNPGPSALTGLGIGWLVLNGRNAGSQQQMRSSAGSQKRSSGDQGPGKAEQVAGQLHATADNVQGKAGEMVDQVQDTASSIAGQAHETADKVTNQTYQTIDQIAEQAQQIPGRLQHLLEENPMAVGAVAIALGGAAALLIPESQREIQFMGEARDKVVDRAQSGAQDVMQKVQRVAEEVEESAGEEARKQGIAPES